MSDDAVRGTLGAGFTATTDLACLAGAEVIVICVPTPLLSENGPDLDAVEFAVRASAAHL
jgi:UDP-N-acetyl-D-glucosamine dehydrogenase